jgi:diguanylate cyclase (GGDEF)-like protein/PAS domain S-box-containing protein
MPIDQSVTVFSGEPLVVGNLDCIPLALLHFGPSRDGYELVELNELARALLGATATELFGRGFSDGLFDEDVECLASALLAAQTQPTAPVLLRWGASSPVVFLMARPQRQSDGSVLVSLQDVTDQYRLDHFVCGRGSRLILTDTQSHITWVSPTTAALLGIRPDTLVGRHVLTGIHPDDAASQQATAEELLAHPGVELVRSWRSRHPFIKDTWWLMRYSQIYLPDDPAIGGIAINVQLITDHGLKTDTAGASQMTLDEMLPGALLMAADGRITLLNNMAARLFRTVKAGDGSYVWIDALVSRYRATVRELVRSAESKGLRGVTTAALDRPGSTAVWLRIETMPTLDTDGKPTGYAATLLDVSVETEARAGLEQAQTQLWQLANHDALTTLPNRMQFNDCLDRALARKRRDRQSVALLFCDLDYFKPVNDRLGHQAGDSVLVEIARRLRSITRATDMVCRVGGDEFGIICEAFGDIAGLELLASRLVEITRQPIPVGIETASVGLSVGVAVASCDSSPEELLSRADQALYRAKGSGRNRFVIDS